jgi:hypothetical protein
MSEAIILTGLLVLTIGTVMLMGDNKSQEISFAELVGQATFSFWCGGLAD